MIKYIDGNILNSKADIIFHQVNCQGVMGSGLAKQIREKYPKHYKEYIKYCNKRAPEKLLGDSVLTFISRTSPLICGIFGQLNYGREKKCYTDYNAVKQAMSKIKQYVNDSHLEKSTFTVPYRMSCGLAGGDWNIILGILEELFVDTSKDKCDITLEIWKYNGDKVKTNATNIGC